jgi:predicted site-specific integrase-resolvase
LRFGAELVFAMREEFEPEVVIVNRSEEMSFEDHLTQDVFEKNPNARCLTTGL